MNLHILNIMHVSISIIFNVIILSWILYEFMIEQYVQTPDQTGSGSITGSDRIGPYFDYYFDFFFIF